MQHFIHYFLHLGLPLILALLFRKKEWKKTYLIFLLTMLVDLDHLFASPIFDPNRCSINYHFLHSYYAMLVYICFLFINKTFRLIGIGLLLHMLTDYIDCLFSENYFDFCFIGLSHQSLLIDVPSSNSIEVCVAILMLT